jgi:hypothetical protein
MNDNPKLDPNAKAPVPDAVAVAVTVCGATDLGRIWVQILLATVNRGRIAQLRRQNGALQGTYGLSTTIDSQEAPNADTSTVDRRREALCR